MYRVLLIGGDDDLRRKTQALLSEVGHVSEISLLSHMPGDIEVARVLQVNQPHVVMIVVTSMISVVDFMQRIEVQSPSTSVIAMSQFTDQRTVRELMHAGVKGFIPVPLVRGVFVDVVRKVFDHLQAERNFDAIPNLFSFLPGRGGSGTSLLACHFSEVLADQTEDGERVLLLDLDLASGLSKFLFERTYAYTLIEMIETGVPLNDLYWNQFVARHGDLDIISGGRYNPRHPVGPLQVKQLLDCAKSKYSAICADLTGNSESYSLEIMRRSKRIFLVTTTDPASLRLTQDRFHFLERLGLGKRVGLLVNHFVHHSSMSANRIATETGVPVLAEFDFDDRKVQEAIRNGIRFETASPVVRQIYKMSEKLVWDLVNETVPT
jgi:pilus assembly protein CpaE